MRWVERAAALTWAAILLDNTWARTLENHDVHTYVDRYAPGG
jgi:hypothetical protein